MKDRLLQRKPLESVSTMDTELKRCLGTMDLTFMGIGAMVGVGIFVYSGILIRHITGPSAILCFFCAGLAAIISGLCYADASAGVAKCATIYTLTYLYIGEYPAFLIGTCLVLDRILQTALVGAALVTFLSSLPPLGPIDVKIPWSLGNITPVPCVFIALAAILVLLGVKSTVRVSKVLVTFNFCVIGFYCLSSWLVLGDIEHLSHPEQGYFPFGAFGFFKGIALAYNAFTGFEIIPSASEECVNPAESIMKAIVISILVVIGCYCSITSSLLILVPWKSVDPDSPYPLAYKQLGQPVLSNITLFAAFITSSNVVLLAVYLGSRYIFTLAEDSRFPRFLAKVHPKTNVPSFAILLVAIVAMLVSSFFEMTELAEMIIITSLVPLITVAFIVLLNQITKTQTLIEENAELTEKSSLIASSQLNLRRKIVALISFCSAIAFLCILLKFTDQWNQIWIIIWAVVPLVVALASLVFLWATTEATSPNHNHFQMPLKPILPGMCLAGNVFLLAQISTHFWLMFVVWLVILSAIYFANISISSSGNRPPTSAPGQLEMD